MLGFGVHLTSVTFALSGLCELVSDEFPTFSISGKRIFQGWKATVPKLEYR